MLLRQPRAARRGAAAVEFAVLAPLFVTLLYGLWEVGRVVEIQQIVNNAAREGARQAASGKYTEAEVAVSVNEYLTNAGVAVKDSAGNPNVTVVVTNVSGGAVKDAPQMNHVSVLINYPYDNIRWVASSKFVANGTTLNAQADWYVMSDVPIVVPVTIPNAPLP